MRWPLVVFVLAVAELAPAVQSWEASEASEAWEADVARLQADAETAFDAHDVAAAASLLERAVALVEANAPPNDARRAVVLDELAVVDTVAKRFDAARPLFERAVAASPGSPAVLAYLTNQFEALARERQSIAAVDDSPAGKQRFARVEALERQLREIDARRKSIAAALGLDSYTDAVDYDALRAYVVPMLGVSLNEVGFIGPLAGAHALNGWCRANLIEGGDPQLTLQLAEHALAIATRQLPDGDARLLPFIVGAAEGYGGAGDVAHAAPLYAQAITLAGKDHAAQTSLYLALGWDLFQHGDVDGARDAFLHAESVVRANGGGDPRSPEMQHVAEGLVEVCLARGENERAAALLAAELPGAASEDFIFERAKLAHVRHLLGDDVTAGRTQRAIVAEWDAKGAGFDEFRAAPLAELAATDEAGGHRDAARALLERAVAASEAHLRELLDGKSALDSERTRREEEIYAAVTKDRYLLDRVVSLGVGGDAAAARLALATVLVQKGRVLEAWGLSLQAMRRHLDPTMRPRFEDWLATRAATSDLVLDAPEHEGDLAYAQRLAHLEAHAATLETQLSRSIAAYRAQAAPVSLANVEAAIPKSAALVEVVAYRPFVARAKTDQAQWAKRRYAACVLRAGQSPVWIDLGDAAAVDASIGALRAALKDWRRADYATLARGVDRALFAPIAARLGGVREVLLSPDGALNLLPFGALVDEKDHFRIETYTFTYVASASDLSPRSEPPTTRPSAPVVMANPAYGVAAKGAERAAAHHQRERTLAQLDWKALPATALEAGQIAPLLPGAVVLTGAAASESALKGLGSPVVLHLATHGYFLNDPDADAEPDARGLRLDDAPAGLPTIANPLLRSGLVLAGANTGGDGGNDGFLTALEVAGLDLSATQLVVLSACDTGVGDVRGGEGVYGLRRALTLSGARSAVISLWSVNDQATRDLMVAYYSALAAGGGRAAALHQAQRAMLADPRRRHPYYWAAFIHSGDSGPLSLAAPVAATVQTAEIAASPMYRDNPQRTGATAQPANRALARRLFKVKLTSTASSPVVVAQDVALVGGQPGVLAAFDARSGAPRWTWSLPGGHGHGWVGYPPTVIDDVAFFADGHEAFRAVDVATGKEAWSRPAEAAPNSSPLVAGGRVFGATSRVFDKGGLMLALDEKTGDQLWSFRPPSSPHEPAFADGVVYFGTWEPLSPAKDHTSTFYALDAATGAERWHATLSDGVLHPPAIAGGRVFVAAVNGEIAAFDAATGKAEWRARMKQEVRPLAVSGGAVYVITSSPFGDNVYALDVATGVESWHLQNGKPATTALIVADGVLYYGSNDSLIAIDVKSGKQWEIAVDAGDGDVKDPTLAGGVVYFTTTNDFLYAIL